MAPRGPVGRAGIGLAPFGALVCAFALSFLLLAGAAAAKPKPAAVGGATVTETSLPERDLFPTSITEGPDGNMWFGLTRANPVSFDALPREAEPAVVRVTPGGGFTEFALPARDTNPRSLLSGPGGDIWFLYDHGVGRITMGGQVTDYPNTDIGGGEGQLVAGPDGNFWLVRAGGREIFRLTPSGEWSGFVQPTQRLNGITAGPDGNVWFTEPFDGQIGKINPAGQADTFPAQGPATEITTGPDGNLWFTLEAGVGRITTAGEVLGAYEAPSPKAPILTGPDGRVWFRSGSAEIGRLTADGRASVIPLLSEVRTLTGIAPGPDGEVWFTATPTLPCLSASHCIIEHRPPGILGRVSIDPLSAAIARQGTAARPRLATVDVNCRGGDADGICRGRVAVSLKRNGRRLAHHRLALKTDETRTYVFSFGRNSRGRKIKFPRGTRLIATARVGGRTARRGLVIH
jgi:streptogramin lyase